MFSADDCESMSGQELTGKVLILKPSILANEYKFPDNQLFLATAGFGCSPSSLGRSIYGIFLKDNEYTSFYAKIMTTIIIVKSDVLMLIFPKYVATMLMIKDKIGIGDNSFIMA